MSSQTYAEGMVEFQPYVRAGVLYDDNLFRFASKTEASAAGFNEQSDRVNTLDAGAQLNLRISRQLVRVNAGINDNKYNRYDFLDNTGKSYGITWDWRLGNDVYGDLSTSNSQSIAGFNDNDIIVRNLRTFKRQRASINWNVLSTWTLYSIAEYSDFENEEAIFQPLDREDDSYEVGTRFQTTSGTQVGLFYKHLKSDFINRVGTSALIFGRENEQDQYGLNLAWLPTLKTRFSGQISTIRFTRENALQNNFNGLNQRWNLDYALSSKTSLGLTAYRELTSVDDLLSTYVLFKGAGANANWNATSKLNFNTSYGVGKREFLGGSSVFSVPVEREDNTKRFGLNMAYAPTEHASLQLRYVNEDRVSNINSFAYQFQSINLIGQYSF
jgi:exopolysaccharide biosynthesis operon protein EpsL